MVSFQAQTEPHSGLTLQGCILLPRPAGILLFIAKVQVSHPAPSTIWVALTNVQVNIITTVHYTRHTCIYITVVLLFISSFYTSSIFLGRLAALHSLCTLQLYQAPDVQIKAFLVYIDDIMVILNWYSWPLKQKASWFILFIGGFLGFFRRHSFFLYCCCCTFSFLFSTSGRRKKKDIKSAVGNQVDLRVFVCAKTPF